MPAIDLVYFAQVREAVGRDAERLDVPDEVATIAQLIDWLAARGEGYAAAFADRSRIRAAIDQIFAHHGAAIAGAREIALFPPVTGG
jgi:molybdopterin synthase sulfur carrier subunit